MRSVAHSRGGSLFSHCHVGLNNKHAICCGRLSKRRPQSGNALQVIGLVCLLSLLALGTSCADRGPTYQGRTVGEWHKQLVADIDDHARETAALALGEIGTIAATKSLISVVKHPDEGIACNALSGVGRILGSEKKLGQLPQRVRRELILVTFSRLNADSRRLRGDAFSALNATLADLPDSMLSVMCQGIGSELYDQGVDVLMAPGPNVRLSDAEVEFNGLLLRIAPKAMLSYPNGEALKAVLCGRLCCTPYWPSGDVAALVRHIQVLPGQECGIGSWAVKAVRSMRQRLSPDDTRNYSDGATLANVLLQIADFVSVDDVLCEELVSIIEKDKDRRAYGYSSECRLIGEEKVPALVMYRGYHTETLHYGALMALCKARNPDKYLAAVESYVARWAGYPWDLIPYDYSLGGCPRGAALDRYFLANRGWMMNERPLYGKLVSRVEYIAHTRACLESAIGSGRGQPVAGAGGPHEVRPKG